MLDNLKTLRPTHIWLGLGTPRQHFLAPLLAKNLPGTVVIGVGAAFDFLSGHVAESPKWVSKIGMEWLYRLSREPRRLTKRYLICFFGLLWIWIKGGF